MKTKITILFIQFIVVTIFSFSQDIKGQLLVDKSKFESDYRLFIEKQKTPLLNAPKEIFLLDGILWQRDHGESEFYLTPSFWNKEEIRIYNERITSRNDKNNGICKSKLVKIDLTPQSLKMIADFSVKVPDYIKKHILALLPQKDIDNLIQAGVPVENIESPKKRNDGALPKSPSVPSGVIWSEGFEGTFPGSNYYVGDDYPASGYDYWDDVSCAHAGGGKSIWCAANGDQPDCVNYDYNMSSWVTKVTSIPVSGATNLSLNFNIKYEMEENIDYLTLMYSIDNGAYYTIMNYYDNSLGDWLPESLPIPNCSLFNWLFTFHSNGTNRNYSGAYIDDMQVVGDINYNCFPLVESLQVNGNSVAFGSTVDVQLANLNQSFEIRLKGKNDDIDMAPPNLSNLTVSFEQYTSSSDKNLITVKSTTSSDLTVNKYFGNEALGGDMYADYVLVEGTDNNGWTGGESNSIYLDVKPKLWGQFVIEFRMGLPTDDTWANFIHDPPGGYCDNCSEWELGVDPIKFYSYYVIVNVTQPTPCLSVTPSNQDVTSTTGSTSFNVTNTCGGTMNYTSEVTEGSSWLTISGGGTGGNSGTINLSYTQNTSCTPRIGTVTVTAPGSTGSPVSVTVSQAANTVPVLTVTPANQIVSNSYGTTSFAVSNAGCGTMNFTSEVTTGSDWLAITAGGSGGNNGTINVSYSANTTCVQRIGTITVTAPEAMNSPVSVTVTQEPNSVPTLSVTPLYQNVPYTTGTTSFNVSNTGCGTMSYIALVTNGSNWLTIIGGGSGGNSGTILVSYTANAGCSQRTGTITVTAQGANSSPQSVTITQAANAVPILSVTPQNQVVPYTLCSTSFAVNNEGCGTMSYSSQVTYGSSWLSITSGGSGGNYGLINVSCTQNNGTVERSGTITVTSSGSAGSQVSVTVTQGTLLTPCLSVTPTNPNVASSGGSTIINVSNPCGGTMNYTAQVTTGSSWLGITSGGSGGNNGTINVAYAQNTGCSSRTGTITVTAPGATGSPVIVNITQAGNSLPVLSVTPQNQNVPNTAGTTSFSVSNTGCGTMNYTAQVTSGSTWLTLTSGGSGVNNGTFNVSYSQNSECAQRIGTITVTAPGATGSPKSVTVTQAGNAVPRLLVTPSNQNVTNTSGTTSFPVSNTGCGTMSYTAQVTNGSAWLTITSGGTGGNTGTINVSYTQNNGTTNRTGTIAVSASGASGSPVSVTVTQGFMPIPCLSATPTNQNVLHTAGTTSFAVSNTCAGTMSYTAHVTDGSSWLTITGGGSGGNSGTINVSYAQNNSESQRIGSITITAPGSSGSPHSVTVTQGGSTIVPFLTASPPALSYGPTNGETKTLNIASNVNWSVAAYYGFWLSFAPASGGNNADITVTTTADNVSGTKRTDTLYIVSAGLPIQKIIVTQEPTNGFEDKILASHVNIFPNPANNMLNVSMDSLIVRSCGISITNLFGEVFYTLEKNKLLKIQIDVSIWPDGIYLLVIKTKDGIITKKIVITN